MRRRWRDCRADANVFFVGLSQRQDSAAVYASSLLLRIYCCGAGLARGVLLDRDRPGALSADDGVRVMEKFVFVFVVIVVWLGGQAISALLLVAAADFLLGVLFLAAFFKTAGLRESAGTVRT